ncbi:30S ribosomal protein S13 [candidate division WOR-3 bacterium]|uniref:Small ribosomal subunit protein uS13 n=1 Tax=candidate division WOR-3 bacterium TaxID=2052148 RepID=A0A9D5KCL9_UNCW3|nr:30S ribosomal protein S13 [candidate division WOR-3 bacterium]MBD3365635.1 30S ribosomal protein S13 [candidate division WOR-3 bacterium]
MARISGVDLPPNKAIEYALPHIYGIGLSTSRKILADTGIDPRKKVKDLDEKELSLIRQEIEEKYKVEGSMRADLSASIKRLVEINCYRGIRHKKGLPVRGQRTRTNARTRKGPKKTSGALKKKKV